MCKGFFTEGVLVCENKNIFYFDIQVNTPSVKKPLHVMQRLFNVQRIANPLTYI